MLQLSIKAGLVSSIEESWAVLTYGNDLPHFVGHHSLLHGRFTRWKFWRCIIRFSSSVFVQWESLRTLVCGSFEHIWTTVDVFQCSQNSFCNKYIKEGAEAISAPGWRPAPRLLILGTSGRMSSIPDFLKGLSLKHAGFGGASELAGAYASATCGRERTATESVARATAAGSHPVVGMVDTAASLAEGAVCQGAKMEQQAADRARANGASASRQRWRACLQVLLLNLEQRPVLPWRWSRWKPQMTHPKLSEEEVKSLLGWFLHD